MIRPGHGGIKPEVNLGRLHHRPTQPPGTLLGDTVMVCDFSAAMGGRDETRIASQLVTRIEPADIAYLGFHQQGYVVSHAGYCREEPDVVGRDVPQLQAVPAGLGFEGDHHLQVAVDGFQVEALETFLSWCIVRALWVF